MADDQGEVGNETLRMTVPSLRGNVPEGSLERLNV
jgi:hypothetical protein